VLNAEQCNAIQTGNWKTHVRYKTEIDFLKTKGDLLLENSHCLKQYEGIISEEAAIYLPNIQVVDSINILD
jgi:hypothetical protein